MFRVRLRCDMDPFSWNSPPRAGSAGLLENAARLTLATYDSMVFIAALPWHSNRPFFGGIRRTCRCRSTSSTTDTIQMRILLNIAMTSRALRLRSYAQMQTRTPYFGTNREALSTGPQHGSFLRPCPSLD